MADLDPQIIVFIVAGVAGIFFLALMMQLNSAAEGKRIQKRLQRTRSMRSAEGDSVASLRRNLGDKRYAAIDELAKKYMPQPALLRSRLERTGYNVSIGQMVVFAVGAGIVITTLIWLVAAPPSGLLLLAFVLTSGALPHLVIKFLIKRREAKFLNDFPEALDLIIRGLKSGLPVGESVRNVGEEFGGPVSEEFKIVSDKVKVGQALEDALADSTKRMEVQDFKFFVISLAVQRETGGNLAETLANLVDILRRRKQMKLKIKAMSSEAKASAYILGSLPFIMFGILLLLNPEYTGLLYTDPRGQVLIGVGFGFISTGALVMKKMISFEI